MAKRSAEQGFGLLELAVSLLLVAVLYGVLATSLSKTAEQAERAAMYGMLGQLQQQLNLKLAQYYIAGQQRSLQTLVRENPFLWAGASSDMVNPAQPMRQSAGLYGGETTAAESTLWEPGVWYYVRDTHELVYLPRRADYLKIEQAQGKTLRFMLKLNGASADNPSIASGFSAKIEAVWPFTWDITE